MGDGQKPNRNWKRSETAAPVFTTGQVKFGGESVNQEQEIVKEGMGRKHLSQGG